MHRLSESFKPTRFADISPRLGRVILFAFLLIIAWGIVCYDKSLSVGQESSGTSSGDAELYRSVINRVHGGESYYEVVGSELRNRNYATRPFFNWKLPLLTWLIAKIMTPQIGRWMLTLLTLATFVTWLRVLDREGGFYTILIGGWLLLGTVISCFTNNAFLFHETWAGVLIAFSIAVRERNRPLSVALGLTALFIRELSLPYVVIMLILAYRKEHRRESLVWLVGIAAFFLYLAAHAKTVSGLQTESDRMNNSWIQFGGWSFVLTTTKWTLPTFLTPLWIDAILLPLALLGAWGWRSAVGRPVALTISLYVLAFLIAGRADNYYWGLMYAPLIPLGLLFGPRSFIDLCKAAFGKKLPI